MLCVCVCIVVATEGCPLLWNSKFKNTENTWKNTEKNTEKTRKNTEKTQKKHDIHGKKQRKKHDFRAKSKIRTNCRGRLPKLQKSTRLREFCWFLKELHSVLRATQKFCGWWNFEKKKHRKNTEKTRYSRKKTQKKHDFRHGENENVILRCRFEIAV